MEIHVLMMLTDDEIDYNTLSDGELKELALGDELFIATSALGELENRNGNLGAEVAWKILSNSKGDRYLQAAALETLFQCNPERALDYMKEQAQKGDRYILNTIVELIFENNSYFQTNSPLSLLYTVLEQVKNLSEDEPVIELEGEDTSMAFMWTPIANAFEAYRRRLIIEPDAVYEHTWRLIHIHESLIVTLGSALATRIFDLNSNNQIKNEDFKLLQIMLTGLSAKNEPIDEKEPRGKGCLSGSIGEWISLLSTAKNFTLESPCEFISKIQDYLDTTPNTQKLAFLDEWERVAPVPKEQTKDGLTRIQRLGAINELRNKLAHVPVSRRIVGKLHDGLRRELLLLLTPEPTVLDVDSKTDLGTIKKWHDALCGRIFYKNAYVEGSSFGPKRKHGNSELKSDSCDTVYWGRPDQNKNNKNQWVQWDASPFVYFDEEFKVYLLFRFTNLSSEPDVDLTGEYYRFAAEVEPVQRHTVSVETIKPWLPKESPSEASSDIPTEISELRTRAENAFTNGSFKEAVNYYSQLADKKNTSIYNHVAKSRHGAALWRVANRSEDNLEERKRLFNQAIKLLDDASQHKEIAYQAEAHYQKSKALWHLAEIDVVDKEDSIKKSIAEAEQAKSLALLERYTSWYEWLQERTDNRETETDNSESETDNSKEEVSESNNS